MATTTARRIAPIQAQDPDRSSRVRTYRRASQWMVLAGMFVAVVYGAAQAPAGRGVIAAFASALACAAPFALGVFVGFLFGIPKTRQRPPVEGAPPDGTETNTNLEQISDWLTKILIGVGLTQLTQIPAELQSVADYLAAAIGDPSEGASAIVATILVYFAIAGFLWGYLVTRLILEPELDRVPDPEAVARLLNAKPPNADGEAVGEHDAAEVLRFPMSAMQTPEQLIAWGRAKLEQDPETAIGALRKALQRSPADRRAVENFAFASLYLPPPEGFQRALDAVREFLGRPGHRDTTDDADLYAYLAAANGQRYRWAVQTAATVSELTAIRDQVVDAAKRAIELLPAWKPLLRKLANPAPGSTEDDLAALANDAALRTLLES